MSAEDTSEPKVEAISTGGRLRAGRDAAGLSLAQLSDITKIPQRHLESLESGDFSALPGRTYALGFARTYARAVGLDGDEIVTAMRAEYTGAMPRADVAPTPAFTPGDPARVPSSGFAWVAGIVALLAAVGGYVWWQNYYTPSLDLPSLLPADKPSPAPSASAPAQPAPTPTPTTPSGPVVFTAQGDSVWVRFYDGASKKILTEKSLSRGESYTVPTDVADPRLWTGHPEQLDITIGGQSIPRLASEMKTMKDVPVTAAALTARGAPAAAPAPGASPAPGGAPTAGTTPGATPAPGTPPAPGATPAPRPHPRPRLHHKSHGETVTPGGILPAGVPLVSPAPTGNP
jgi:cytoskeleton protein RodZ